MAFSSHTSFCAVYGNGNERQAKLYLYTFFFSQTYLTAALVYLGLGFPALFVKGIKSLIVTAAHSSIKWDKPFYTIKWLHPIGWVMERLISTPATHHAHHADSDDGWCWAL